jgi:hypothetical protein
VSLKDAEGGFVSPGLGCVYESPQHGIGLVREEFGVGFQDAAGFLPGFGLDEGEEGLHKLRAPPPFSKCFLYPDLPAAAQQDTVFLQDAAGFLIALGLGGGDPLSQQGVRLIREQLGMGFQDAAGFVPGAGPDELLQGLGQGAQGGLGVFA